MIKRTRLNDAITRAFSASRLPGVISVKRFSRTRFTVKRFSEEGETVYDDTIVDPESADLGTEEVAQDVPTDNVTVFSDEDAGTDEIVAAADGADITPVIDAKEDQGFSEDTPEAEFCGDDMAMFDGEDELDESVEDDTELEGMDDTAAALAQYSRRFSRMY